MLVTKREAHRIAQGRKTTHRIPRSKVPPAGHKTVPVQFRQPNPALGYIDGEPKLELLTRCYVHITDVAPGHVLDVDHQAALDEGFPTSIDFQKDWEARYGRVVNMWVITFSLDHTYRPRFLSRNVVPGKQSDYVRDPAVALTGEPEAVPEEVLVSYAAEAHRRDRERQAEGRALLRQMGKESRLAALEAEARLRHIDIRNELRVIKRYGDKERVWEHNLALIESKLGIVARSG